MCERWYSLKKKKRKSLKSLHYLSSPNKSRMYFLMSCDSSIFILYNDLLLFSSLSFHHPSSLLLLKNTMLKYKGWFVILNYLTSVLLVSIRVVIVTVLVRLVAVTVKIIVIYQNIYSYYYNCITIVVMSSKYEKKDKSDFQMWDNF